MRKLLIISLLIVIIFSCKENNKQQNNIIIYKLNANLTKFIQDSIINKYKKITVCEINEYEDFTMLFWVKDINKFSPSLKKIIINTNQYLMINNIKIPVFYSVEVILMEQTEKKLNLKINDDKNFILLRLSVGKELNIIDYFDYAKIYNNK